MFATSRLGLCGAAVLVAAAPAFGQDAGVVERPTLVSDAVPEYPTKAWADQVEADVVVLLTVDEEGAVTDVELVEPAGHGFDESALVAARNLRFTPAKIDGAPVAVQIRYTFRFRVPEKATVAAPPEPAPCTECAPADDRKPGRITITVLERGRGTRMAGVEVYVLDEDRVILTDADGKLTFEGPPGAYAFTIRPPAFYPYHATERVEAGEHLELEYYVRRHRRARYSTIVWGTEGRAQVARTSLVEDEIRTVAGTMGDPIRVAMLLPGVAASVSGVGYPIVRGALPGDMLYEVDGIRVPMLYHLLFGPAVIHPRFVDQITFQPGGYAAEDGRFPGGKIGATTARVDDDPLWVADLSIVETSLFRAQKFGPGNKGEMVAAARYGTLGYIVEGLASNTVFRYWDYQARVGYWLPTGGKLTFTVLGAADAAGELDPDTGEEDVLSLGFHTADLRYRHGFGNAWAVGGVQLSHEFIEPPDEDDGDDDFGGSDMQSVRPYAEVGWAAARGLELRAGGDILYQDFGLTLGEDEDVFTSPADTGATFGGWASLEWTLGDVLLHPSVRIDHYRYDGVREDRETAVDPRLSASYQATTDVAVKAAAGVHSGPARLSFVEPPIVFGPVPAFEGLGLMRGLSRTYQVQAGVEVDLPRDFEVSATGFYHDIHSGIDFSVIDEPATADTTPCNGDDGDTLDPFDIDGASYGAELLLRRRLGHAVYGWTSYALSNSSRTISGRDVPFDFDQRHVLNTVVSWEVGRNWTLGGVFHFNTGNPYTPEVADRCPGGFFEPRRGATNSARLPSYWRVDLRVQKREVFDTWFFDFYIDLFNALFQWETVGYDIDPDTGQPEAEEVPLFVPIIGIRGEF